MTKERVSLFTDFNGKFKARLSAVIPSHITSTSENAPISAKYDCRIKAEYHKDIMSLLEEGMVSRYSTLKGQDLNAGLFDESLLLSDRYLADRKNLKFHLWMIQSLRIVLTIL